MPEETSPPHNEPATASDSFPELANITPVLPKPTPSPSALPSPPINNTPPPSTSPVDTSPPPPMDGAPDTLEDIVDGLKGAGLLEGEGESPSDQSPIPEPEEGEAPPDPEADDIATGDFKTLKFKHKEALQAKDLEVSTLQTRLDELEGQISEGNSNLAEERDKAREEASKFEHEAEDARKLADMNKQYKDIYDTENSEEYQTEFIAPMSNCLGVLYKYAKDYGVPKGYVDNILEEENLQVSNQILADHFPQVAIGQMQPYIQSYQALLSKKREADSAPMELRQQLQTERLENERVEKKQLDDRFAAVTNESWEEINNIYAQYEQTKPYFTEDDNGVAKYARTLYDQVMEGFRVAGGVKVDPNFVKAIAATSHKAAAFDTMVKDLEETKKSNSELTTTIENIKKASPGVRTSPDVIPSMSPIPTDPGKLPGKGDLLEMLQKRSHDLKNTPLAN